MDVLTRHVEFFRSALLPGLQGIRTCVLWGVLATWLTPLDSWAQPAILEQPVSVTTKLESSVAFSVQVSGQSPISYQWRLNGENIPGANDDRHEINNATVEDAGSYSVIASDATGAVLSQTALLLFDNIPEVRPSDDFEESVFLQGQTGLLFSDNFQATREDGEPLHVGKFGDRSVWYAWSADFTGVATFTTKGSTYDTLLAAYAGSALDRLEPLAGDDDHGGARTSEIQFNVKKGEEYRLAIDGLGGDQGVFILLWNLEDTEEQVPEIVLEPKSQTVRKGDPVTFEVGLRYEGNYSFQWYLNGMPIDEANEQGYRLASVEPSDVGTYELRILDSRQRTVRSQPATLELGPDGEIQSVDKVLDLISESLTRNRAGIPQGLTSSVDASGSRISFSLGVGSTVSQTINNAGSVPEPETQPHCAIVGGADRWITLEPLVNGMCEVDTVGSAIDTVIAVYEWTGSILSTLARPLTCNDDILPGVDVQSRVLFEARQGAIYWVALDGRDGVEGTINFQIRFGLPPQSVLSGPPLELVLPKGSDYRWEAGFAPNPFPTSFRWRHNGVSVSGGLGSFLDLTNLQISDSGDYTVEASNFAGSTRNVLGRIVVDTLQRSAPYRTASGDFGFRVQGDAGQRFKIEATTDFGIWIQAADITLTPTIRIYDFVDRDTGLFPRRFYRVEPVWP